MEFRFILFILAFSFATNSSHVGITEKHHFVLVKENSPTTLGCTGPALTGDIFINWMVKSDDVGEWKLIYSASEKKKFAGEALMKSMQMSFKSSQGTGNFSLFLSPTMEDSGFYSCLIKENGTKRMEKTFLLAVLRVSFYPDAPVPKNSILRLFGRVTPASAISKITWTAPGGLSMKTEKKPNTGTVTKVPQVQKSDGGTYICSVYPMGNGTNVLAVNVTVTVDADKEASFSNSEQNRMIHTGIPALKPIRLTCPNVPGDFVQLYWIRSNFNNKKSVVKLEYRYDRWRDFTQKQNERIQLAGPPYSAKAGNFSFLLTPDLNNSGVYLCKVYLNDVVFDQKTKLSVLKVLTRKYSSKQELMCQYSELSQVQRVVWEHHNESRQLKWNTGAPGSISTTLPLPITSNVTGNYTCVLQLKNGQIIKAYQLIKLSPEESVSVTTPSRLPSLSALLLLVPLVAAAVGVLLWRQKHISDRGVEQSLSVRSGETENLYENPEDIRQDLKPRGENDVYKELERYEQCQG
ncbi:g6f-like isoform X2 [Kryptolebias marmoratus]|uniref:g6f-like isoform X2 n=1 Tax=Kryptolebias marmoratus TaxID=37003 RepID=UPI0018AC92A9|nr:g6f-like isoform X2 [Kryptolebias marmoratus]